MKPKIIMLLLLLNLLSCKNKEETDTQTLNKNSEESKLKESRNSKFNLDTFLISKGQIGEIKVGMNLYDAEKSLVEMTKKEVEAYGFGYGGGGKAFLYSIQNEPILAIIPHRDTAEILALIALSDKLKTTNGLHPNSDIFDILKRYPKMKVRQDLMSDNE